MYHQFIIIIYINEDIYKNYFLLNNDLIIYRRNQGTRQLSHIIINIYKCRLKII